MSWLERHPRLNRPVQFAGLALVVLATAYLEIQMTRESGRVASIWLVNGVVVLALLRTSSRRWPGWLLCGLAGNLGASLASGDLGWLAAALSLCNSLEVLMVAGLFRLLVPEVRPDLARVRNLFSFVAVGGVAGPAAAGALAAGVLHLHLGLPFWTVFRTWSSADALGLMILVPLFAGTTWQEVKGLLASPSALEFLALLILVPLAATMILRGHAPWIFLMSPLFLWAAFRFGFVGVAGGIFLAAAAGATVLPLEFQAGHLRNLRGDILFLQAFLVTSVAVFLPMASLIKALRESETQFRLLFDRAPIGMAIVDSTTGLFLSANPRLGEILGYAPADLQERTFQELTHPDHRERDLDSVRELASGTREEVEKEKRYLHASGRVVHGRLRMVRLPPAPGGLPRHLSLVEDITASSLAQAEKMEALDRLQKIAGRLPGAVYQYRLSPEGHASIPYASEAMYEIFRVRKEDLREDLSRINAAHHPDDHADIVASIQVSARDLTPWKQDYRLKFEDGTIRHLLGDAVPQREEDGSILWTGFLADVTERRQMEARLVQSQKMESLGLLAGGIAHDMNNALGAILGLASAHLAIQPRDSAAYRAFDTIREAATRGGSLVKGLLNFSRQSPGEWQVVDLNGIILESARILEHTTLARIRLALALDPDLVRLHGDAGALSHMIMNLCVNAVDAMPEQGLLSIRTRNLPEGGIEAMVEDDGIGMSLDVAGKAMDPFFTTKEVGKGTGLGLSIVYATMTAHQGRIEIQSEPGRGTRILLRFPGGVTTREGAPSRRESSLDRPGKALSVLLVDDDDLVLASTRMLVEVLGHAVTTASSGEEALGKMEAGFRPDVVVLDMNMPGLGGRGTLPRLRGLCPAVPVILSTGRADQEALALASEDPRAVMLAKPFSIEEFQGHLERLCRPA